MLWVKAKNFAYDAIVTKHCPVFLDLTPGRPVGPHKTRTYYPVRNLTEPCTHCSVNLTCF